LPIKGIVRRAHVKHFAFCGLIDHRSSIMKRRASRSLSRPRGNGFRSFAKAGLSTALSAYRARQRTIQNVGRKQSAPAPITGESDYRGVYKRKPMPRYKRVRWTRFKKKVSAVISSKLATSCHVVVSSGVSTSSINKQNYFWNAMYGCNGDVETNDIRRIFERVEGIGATTAKLNRKIVMTGALFELQLVNTGAGTVYVDCYYWKCKNDTPQNASTNSGGYAVNNVADLVTAGLTQMDFNTPIGGSTLDLNDYGVTPFQSAVFSRFVQVWKKTRVKLAVGGTCQLELRDGKNYWTNWQYDSNKVFKRNQSQGIFIINYGVPSAMNGVADSSTVRWSINKNYSFKVLEDSTSAGSTNVL
jgi:hypothetical protein